MDIAVQHQAETNTFLHKTGQLVLTYLLKQSCGRIQQILRDSELVLEYCCLSADSDDTNSDTANGVVVALRPTGKPIVVSIDFHAVLSLATSWDILTSDLKELEEMISTAKKLCNLLIPPDVRALVDSPDVKHLYLCPDVILSVLPLEFLMFDDGDSLGEKCTISYLSSARELLQDEAVEAIVAVKDIVARMMAGEDVPSVPTESSPDTPVEAGEPEEKLATRESSSKAGRKTASTDVEVTDANEIIAEAKPGEGVNAKAVQPSPDQPLEMKVGEATQSTPPESSSSAANDSSSIDADSTAMKECVLVFAPNYDLEKSESSLWGSVVQSFASLFAEPSKAPKPSKALPASEREATQVKEIIAKSAYPVKVRELKGDDANMMSVLHVEAPFILHLSTHGFSQPDPRGTRSSFWDDTKSGILLAGSNTFQAGNLAKVVPAAGTGVLTSLAACGMNLKGTHLVFLSTCVSSYGNFSFNESVNSLAQAFRSSGAQTVIATLWKVVDDTAAHFAKYFYEEAFQKNIRPSQALVCAKERVKQETVYKHWKYWGGFVCIGEDLPLFP